MPFFLLLLLLLLLFLAFQEQLVSLNVLQKCNDISLANCLCRLAWQPGNQGQVIILVCATMDELEAHSGSQSVCLSVCLLLSGVGGSIW